MNPEDLSTTEKVVAKIERLLSRDVTEVERSLINFTVQQLEFDLVDIN